MKYKLTFSLFVAFIGMMVSAMPEPLLGDSGSSRLLELNKTYAEDLERLKEIDQNSEEAKLRKRRLLMNRQEILKLLEEEKTQYGDEWIERYRDEQGKLPGGFIEDARSRVVKLRETRVKQAEKADAIRKGYDELMKKAKPVEERWEDRLLKDQNKFREKFVAEHGPSRDWTEEERQEYAKKFNELSEKSKEQWEKDRKEYSETMRAVGRKIKELAEAQAELHFIDRKIRQEEKKVPPTIKEEKEDDKSITDKEDEEELEELDIEPEMEEMDRPPQRSLKFKDNNGWSRNTYPLEKDIQLELILPRTFYGFGENEFFNVDVINTWNGLKKTIRVKNKWSSTYTSDPFSPSLFEARPAHLLVAKYRDLTAMAKMEGEPTEEDTLSPEVEEDERSEGPELWFEGEFDKQNLSYPVDRPLILILDTKGQLKEHPTLSKGYGWAKVTNLRNDVIRNRLLIESGDDHRFRSERISPDAFDGKAGDEIVAEFDGLTAAVKLYREEEEEKEEIPVTGEIDEDIELDELEAELEIDWDDSFEATLLFKDTKKWNRKSCPVDEKLFLEYRPRTSRFIERGSIEFDYCNADITNTRNGVTKTLALVEAAAFRSWLFSPKLFDARPGDTLIAKCHGLVATIVITEPTGKTEPTDNRFILRTITKTGPSEEADCDADLRIYISINGEKAHRQELDDPEDDFESGAVDSFDREFNYPIDKIRYIQIDTTGDDRWHCVNISYQFIQGDKKSRIYKFPIDAWFPRSWVITNWLNPGVDGLK